MKSSLVLIVMMFLFSCSDSPPPSTIKTDKGIIEVSPSERSDFEYVIFEADSCEYIKFSSDKWSWGGHRARCKYCLQRNNKPCK